MVFVTKLICFLLMVVILCGINADSSCIQHEYVCDDETDECQHSLKLAENQEECGCADIETEIHQLKRQLRKLRKQDCTDSDQPDDSNSEGDKEDTAGENSNDQDTQTPIQDCADLFAVNSSLTDGVYHIHPQNFHKILVHCEKDRRGVWTVIQHRSSDGVDFHQNWHQYKYGFGDVHGNHWLGNEQIYHLTNQARYKLRVDVEDYNGEKAYAEYDRIYTGSEDESYVLHVGHYYGTAGNAMHTGQKFSTQDRDNDNSDYVHCSEVYRGGWWYSDCGDSNVNGPYYGMFWNPWAQVGNKHVKVVTMKIKRTN